jgi:hypothetical protein
MFANLEARNWRDEAHDFEKTFDPFKKNEAIVNEFINKNDGSIP